MQIAIDTGGTFTDCVYYAGEEVRVLKLASTPVDPGAAVLNAVRQLNDSGDVEVRHGTTVGTNALLERKGARVAFVTTAGFEDTIAIGRQARPELYNLFYQRPPLLAPKELRFGVRERTASDGSILEQPDRTELSRLRKALEAARPEAVAISLLFAFANPANELLVLQALEELDLPISVSHRILPEFREYERGSTVLINAYLAPKMQNYLRRLNTELGGKLHVMQSSGGIIDAEMAAREPVRTILSGPAGGVVGAAAIARRAGFPRILTFDMGGTSTDVALVDGSRDLRTTTESLVMGMPVAVPMLNIHTVGAGGGSIASFDRGGALKVGPESAGADPGPICYGRGTLPTVTDANLLLGRLEKGGLLGGELPLDAERTAGFMERAQGSMESTEEFAEGIVRVVNAHMEKALRKISIEGGYDPREYVLLSFGGAGPLHACALARSLKIPQVLVPPMPGALSALGILLSDLVRDYSKTVMTSPDDPALEQEFAALVAAGHDDLGGGEAQKSVDLRYQGQGFELTVDWAPDFVDRFHREHERKYGYADRTRTVEVVNVRVRVVIRSAYPEIRERLAQTGDGGEAVVAERAVFDEARWQQAKIYRRDGLKPGDAFSGPAVITEYSATTYVPADARVRVDGWMNLVIDIAN